LFPVPDGERAAVFDESLELLRLLLTTEKADFAGRFFTVSGASVSPRPAKPLDIWLGGSAPAALRRVGRLADGWLGSLLTPAEAGEAVTLIQDAAAEAGREVEEDHFGLSLPVTLNGIPDALLASIRRRRPEADPATLVARGWDDARRMLGQYVEAGLSKFVVRPAGPGPFGPFLDGFVRELLPIQNLLTGACARSGSAAPGTAGRTPRTRARPAAVLSHWPPRRRRRAARRTRGPRRWSARRSARLYK
jgi:probable F420-dependent oxidoreductase